MAVNKLAGLICLSSVLSFAGSWSGALVDSKCYDSRERNVGPTDTLTSVDRDTRMEIQYCSPKAKTKSFAVVQREGPSFKLDMGGNAKAIQLVQKTGKKPLFLVAVTGEVTGNTITVDSISLAK